MILGIIGAMSEELEILLNDMELEDTKVKAKMTFHKGKLWGKDVVAVVCGIGKVNAAVCTQLLISEYEVTHIVNVGVAGGLSNNIKVLDIVVGKKLVQHDFDITAFDHEKGFIPNCGVYLNSDDYLLNITKNILKFIVCIHNTKTTSTCKLPYIYNVFSIICICITFISYFSSFKI